MATMPTARQRHAVTETDDIAAALDQAAREWPGVPRPQLIGCVLADWADAHGARTAREAARAALVGSLPGSHTLYDRDADWPE